jgi:DNA-binding NtrC family response regulator
MGRRIKILIADDEEGLRLSMAGILELEGHCVTTAADGFEAIDKAKQETFDMVFLDIKMPGINGVETYKEIKKILPATVTVMMTAFAVNDLIKEALHEGAFACITKPFEMDTILSIIEDIGSK